MIVMLRSLNTRKMPTFKPDRRHLTSYFNYSSSFLGGPRCGGVQSLEACLSHKFVFVSSYLSA